MKAFTPHIFPTHTASRSGKLKPHRQKIEASLLAVQTQAGQTAAPSSGPHPSPSLPPSLSPDTFLKIYFCEPVYLE